MNISIEDKKSEAVRRMEILGVYPETVEHFKKHNLVSISMPPIGAFFWAQDEDTKAIKEFEKKYNALVYMVVRSYHKEFGKLDSYFYVSDHIDEWETDVSEFKDGIAFVYVCNCDVPYCSEFGSIGFSRTIAAGLIRTW